MAKIYRPSYSEVVNAGEQRLIDFLEVKLPDDYAVICNGEYAQQNRNGVVQYYEFDCIVVAPHAIFHLENKDWGGKLEGNDDFWYVNDSERKNPLKTAQFKSRVLKSKLIVQDPDWRRCEVITAITLSNPSQSKFYFDPRALCFNQTFLLDQELVDFITDAERFRKPENCIADIQQKVVDFLSGTISERSHAQRTRILEYEIDEVLQRTEDFSEYLCHHLMLGDDKKKIIREYPLDKAGLSPMQLEEWQNKVKNALYAQSEIGHNPYIIPSEYRSNSEMTFLYEISDYMRHNTLRSIMKLNPDMTVMDKFKIILNVANALKAIAEKGVFHRDICPENIYVTGSDNAAIANFGKAYFAKHQDKKFTVKSMLASESSPYRPPEFSDDDVCDSSDVYSLGVVIYELFVGKTPYPDTFSFRSHGGKVAEELLPSHVSDSLPKFLDEIIQHTVVEDLDERWNADELIKFITEELYRSTGNKHKSGEDNTGNVQVRLKDLKPGDKITASLVLYEELGAGAFGRVFKAKNTLVDKFYAVKLFERSAESIDDTRNEFLALSEINHPNVVKIWNCDVSQQGLFYTQMDLLEGENLRDYTKGDVKLPLNEIYNLAHSILSALVYMQKKVPPIFHRDIKPNNIVWHKREKFVLIDFNISAAGGNSAFAGTQVYMAPDLAVSSHKYEWDCSADTFSLGVTLFELLAHALPWTGTNPIPKLTVPATNISAYRSDLSDAFEEFLMKSIITDKDKRFKTAQEMLDALEAIGVDGLTREKGPGVVFVHQKEGVTEDIVDYINSLYSQSTHGNAGTRSNSIQNTLDDLTYTETRLDKKLLDDIKRLKYRLVIITGNAGDGKTAFIRKVEKCGTDIRQFEEGNGSRFVIDGVTFESNYDGSQDEGDNANQEVLEKFFQPFYGLDDYSQVTDGRIIAINEGRLVDFLMTHKELKPLYDNIDDYFYNEGHVKLLPGLMVINLNLRSVTARGEQEESLLHSQIKKLTAPALWSKCENCPIADKCFIRYNVTTFQDSSASDEIVSRWEWLLRTVVYKRELHITMRDLRSFIAFMLTRDCSCDQVKQILEHIKADNVRPEFYWQYYYFNLPSEDFIQKEGTYFPFPGLDSTDRLVQILKDTDIARVSLPAFDRDLFFKEKTPHSYLVFADRKQSLHKEFNACNVIPAPRDNDADDDDNNDPNAEATVVDETLLVARHQSFIRHQFFEGASSKDPDKFDFMRRLPYQSIGEFYHYLTDLGGSTAEKLNEIKANIAIAISRSEGCISDDITRERMLLKCNHINDPLSKSYRAFDVADFELFVNRTPHLVEYIEYESDSLVFRHKSDTFIQLTISLDLFEMLEYIRKGFSPSVNDLQGKFIELQIFKNLLESRNYSEILVTKNNKKFYAVRLKEDNTLSIQLIKQEEDDNQSK